MPTVISRGDKFLARARAAGQAASRSFHDKRAALRWALATEDAMRAGLYQPEQTAAVMTLAKALSRYQRDISARKRSADKEASIIRALASASIAAKPLDQVQASDVTQLRNNLARDKAPATVARHLAVLGHVFQVSKLDWGVPCGNPVRDIRKPTIRNQRDRRYQEGEFEAVIEASDSAVLPAVAGLALATCMRLGEVVNLQWRYVDLAASVAHLVETKNGYGRDVPLTAKAVEILRNLPRTGERVFNVRADAMSKAWSRAAKRARAAYEAQCKREGVTPDPDWLVGVRFHDSRHTRVSELHELGLSLGEIQAISGHRTLTQLARYSHVRASHLVNKLAQLEGGMP
ncbi:tyrosine-type recombinase/integrase [Bordetella tumbae]|uniref:tyrosine-type recombinase/integrase n=1 Tax=Bordetella tumbae TaxID=1649139 RepID=UPI0039EE65D3